MNDTHSGYTGCGHVAATVDNYNYSIWYDPVDIWYDNTSVEPYYLSDYPNSLAIVLDFFVVIEFSDGYLYTSSFSSNFLLIPPTYTYSREYSETEEGGRGGGYWHVQLLQP